MTSIRRFSSIFTITIFLSVSVAQKELVFRSPTGSRIISIKKSEEISCGLNGQKGSELKDNLTITSTENNLVCEGAKTDGVKCRWVSGGVDGLSSLAVVPPAPGTYSCQCTQCNLAPATALVFFADTTKLTLNLTPDNSYQDIDQMVYQNRTNFTLSCMSQDLQNLQTNFLWYRNNKLIQNDSHHQINGGDLTVIITMKNSNDSNRFSGIYMCETVKSEQDGPLRAFFEIKGSASIVGGLNQNKVEGESATLTCDTIGQPPPRVTWERTNGAPPPDRAVSGYTGLSTATLTIRDVIPDDYGEYVCKLDNGRSAKTLLRVRSKLAPLWPFLGILAELALLAAIIIIHEKRCAKKEEDEENDDGGDRKKSPTNSNEDNGLRQRKS